MLVIEKVVLDWFYHQAASCSSSRCACELPFSSEQVHDLYFELGSGMDARPHHPREARASREERRRRARRMSTLNRDFWVLEPGNLIVFINGADEGRRGYFSRFA